MSEKKYELPTEMSFSSVSTSLAELSDNLAFQAKNVKNEAGAAAFDLISGDSLEDEAEIRQTVSVAKGQVDTYLAISQDLSLIGASLADQLPTIRVFKPLSTDSVNISKPRNVPTMVISMSINSGPALSPKRVYPGQDCKTFIVSQDHADYLVELVSVDTVEGDEDVTTEIILSCKILATLVNGYVESAKATTTSRTSATKPNTSAKPKSTAGKSTAKKPAASAAPKRKPRGSK